MTPSPACYALTRASEDCRLHAYQDSGGVWTVGTGHTKGAYRGQVITEADAERLLEADMAEAAADVTRLAGECTQGQFDALCDFTFNLGEGKLAGSTLLHRHKAGDFEGAAAEFGRWVYAGGEKLRGLVTRRVAEAALYLS